MPKSNVGGLPVSAGVARGGRALGLGRATRRCSEASGKPGKKVGLASDAHVRPTLFAAGLANFLPNPTHQGFRLAPGEIGLRGVIWIHQRHIKGRIPGVISAIENRNLLWRQKSLRRQLLRLDESSKLVCSEDCRGHTTKSYTIELDRQRTLVPEFECNFNHLR